MSPNVGNFVHDLVEMAKAMETLPQVERELSLAKAKIDELSQSVQERELRIIDYKSKVDELLARVRATEAERDDAELRFLELDEKAHKISAVLDTIASSAMGAFDQLTPPKPQPEPEPVTEQHPNPQTFTGFEPQVQGQSEAPPTNQSSQAGDNNGLTTTSVSGQAHGDLAGSPSTQSPASQSQGEVNPTLEPAPSMVDQSASGVNDGTTVGASAEPQPGPYAGKYYSDHPVYVSLYDWLAGGGTEYFYYAGRPVGPSNF